METGQVVTVRNGDGVGQDIVFCFLYLLVHDYVLAETLIHKWFAEGEEHVEESANKLIYLSSTNLK